MRPTPCRPFGRVPPRSADPINARFNLRSASPRSVPVLRTVRFQPPTRFHGSPSRRASALPIARRRLFQSMKREGSAAAVLPSFRRPASLVPSFTEADEERFASEDMTTNDSPVGSHLVLPISVLCVSVDDMCPCLRTLLLGKGRPAGSFGEWATTSDGWANSDTWKGSNHYGRATPREKGHRSNLSQGRWRGTQPLRPSVARGARTRTLPSRYLQVSGWQHVL